jgi:hypothetical protein
MSHPQSARAAGQHLHLMLAHEDQQMFCIGSGIIHDQSVIEDQERLTIRCRLQLWPDVQKVFKDLWQEGKSLYSLSFTMNGPVQRLLGVQEGCPTRQICLQGNSNVSPRTVRGTTVVICLPA